MSGIRLIALDMDGTLLDSEQRISQENRRWIRRARKAGVAVVLASGRAMRGLAPYLAELELDGPVVAANGSEVWETPDRLLERHVLEARDVLRMRELARQHGDVWFWAYAVSRLYNRDAWCEDPEREQWLKFGYSDEDPAELARLRTAVRGWGAFEVTNSSPVNIEINPPGVSKQSGLERVCALLGLGMHEVMAIGDSLNDLAMIRAAGIGVAMGNAQEEVREAADRVTDHHDADGVARAIREWGLPRASGGG